MKSDTSQRIYDYIQKNQQATAFQLKEYLGISYPAVFKQLKKMQALGSIYKIGSPPVVYYLINESKSEYLTEDEIKDEEVIKTIEENYLNITPTGELLTGVEGFRWWCNSQKLPLNKTALEYQKTLQKYLIYREGGLIDGMPKLRATFPEVYLDELYYLDFYSIERFGKTKLGALILYAKQSQELDLIRQITELVRPEIFNLVKRQDIQAVGFVPPTVLRNVQLQKKLELKLGLGLPKIKMVKVYKAVRVAQKTLSRLSDRQLNAKQTLIVQSVPMAKNILLIDDALGSGASLNEISAKIKLIRPTAKVIGLALVGSFKGFEVLNEV